ncbi:MAG: cytidine deaminase, partial [Fervidicoccus fontis]
DKLALEMLDEAGVEIIKFIPDNKEV